MPSRSSKRRFTPVSSKTQKLLNEVGVDGLVRLIKTNLPIKLQLQSYRWERQDAGDSLFVNLEVYLSETCNENTKNTFGIMSDIEREKIKSLVKEEVSKYEDVSEWVVAFSINGTVVDSIFSER